MTRWAMALGALFFTGFFMSCQNATSTAPYGGPSAGPPYSVTYKNTTVNTTGAVPVDSTAYPSGALVKVLGNTGGLSWPPFTFVGWNTQDNGGIDGGGGGTSYLPGDTFTITANVVLYGTWK